MKKLSFMALTLLTSTVALAEGGGGHGGGGHGEPHVSNWWKVGPEYANTPALGLLSITFAIFLGGLIYFVRPKLSVHLENRSDEVKKAIEEAKRAREAAEARARDAEQKLANLETEMNRLKGDFQQQGEAELQRIEKMASDTAARIAKDAEDTIKAEKDRAQHALRAEAARLALELAEQRIKGALSADDDARLRQSLIAGLDSPAQKRDNKSAEA